MKFDYDKMGEKEVAQQCKNWSVCRWGHGGKDLYESSSGLSYKEDSLRCHKNPSLSAVSWAASSGSAGTRAHQSSEASWTHATCPLGVLCFLIEHAAVIKERVVYWTVLLQYTTNFDRCSGLHSVQSFQAGIWFSWVAFCFLAMVQNAPIGHNIRHTITFWYVIVQNLPWMSFYYSILQ